MAYNPTFCKSSLSCNCHLLFKQELWVQENPQVVVPSHSELKMSKTRILGPHAPHAPFGLARFQLKPVVSMQALTVSGHWLRAGTASFGSSGLHKEVFLCFFGDGQNLTWTQKNQRKCVFFQLQLFISYNKYTKKRFLGKIELNIIKSVSTVYNRKEDSHSHKKSCFHVVSKESLTSIDIFQRMSES